MSSTNAATMQEIPADELLAQLCKASADSLRLDILRVLSADSFSVQELCQILGLKQSALSHHLKILAAAELVTTRREGNTQFYRRCPLPHEHLFADWQSALFASLDRCPMTTVQLAGIATVEAARTASSQQFFLENAAKFREQQDMIASFEQYADSVDTFIQILALPSYDKALEIGPGDGRFLNRLAPRFTQVYAYDTSPAMFNTAQASITSEALTNVQLTLGDTTLAAQQHTDCDCIVINMVLHHIASPADIFADTAAMLKPGAALIITDLCHHDQSWAKESCGDLWLGFEPEDLTAWATTAGLKEGQSSFLAQRNGFRIQIRHFFKPEIQTTNKLLPNEGNNP